MAYGTAKVDTLQSSTKTVQVDDLAVSADLGTAAAEDVGTSAGNVVQLDGSARLPAVDGSQLTNLPVAVGTDLSYTASTRVLASSTGTDATLPEATTSEAGLLSAADKTKLDGVAAGAEVNVNADWNASSGDAEILNKPSIPAALDDLGDVDLQTAAPSDGEALVYDAGTQTWVPGSAGASAAGSANEIQYNDGSSGLAASADLTWDDTAKELGVGGDINLDDGGTYSTTLQMVTATANRVISFPDATGTVALVGGSSGQLTYNNAGALAGASTLTYDGSILTSSGRFINSYNATASSPAKSFTGTWFTGGTATTTKPQVLIEPAGTTSTAWSTSGTGLGVNAASGFTGNLLDLQVNGTSRVFISAASTPVLGGSGGLTITPTGSLLGVGAGGTISWYFTSNAIAAATNAATVIFGASSDLVLARDAAQILAQRNGTNAQTFRVYNTYTSGTNYELGKLEWSSNVFRIGTEKGSAGGTARTVEVHTDSISRLALDTTGSVRVVTGLTVATLPGTPAVGMIARVTDATAPAVGSTVTGGGADAALVWYNGANWSVIGV